MIARLLFRFAGRLPLRIISDNGQPYLERYWLGKAFGCHAYLHRFVGPDPDRGLHDHPWPWAVSLVLAGSYSEIRRDGTRRRSWANIIVGDTFHRIATAERETWTLFIHRAVKSKPWGFWRDGTELLPTPSPPSLEQAIWTEHPSGSDGWWDVVERGDRTIGRVPFGELPGGAQ